MVIGTLPTDPLRSFGPVVAGRTLFLPPMAGHEAHSQSSLAARATASSSPRRGKPPPPVDPFPGDSVETDLDDWLPTMERAASWNVWSDEEMLMQLAGHLRGGALQEWNKIPREEKSHTQMPLARCAPESTQENRVLAGQDFRHAILDSTESVADYVRRLERLFQLAYGRESLSSETRDTILYSQLQEGLSYNLMKSPAVSGSDSYKQLSVSAKREEKWIVELSRRQQYLKDGTPRRNDDRFPTQQLPPRGTVPGGTNRSVLSASLPCVRGAVEDYREELMVSLSSARELAVENMRKAQEKYKRNYDRRVSTPSSPMKCGDWVLVHFQHEESGPNRKLSRSWHGPYRIISVNDPDLSMVKVYFPQDQSIQVHQS